MIFRNHFNLKWIIRYKCCTSSALVVKRQVGLYNQACVVVGNICCDTLLLTSRRLVFLGIGNRVTQSYSWVSQKHETKDVDSSSHC